MGITVIGSLNYDLVTYTDKVPDGGKQYVQIRSRLIQEVRVAINV